MALDHGQFQCLFESERDRVFRLLYRLTGNAADADDLLQEAFLTAWRNREQFEGRGSAAGWLVRTAFRLYLDWRRKGARRLRIAGRVETWTDDASPAASRNGSAAIGAETRDAHGFLLARVQEALASLPEGPREAFVMFRFEGMPVQEIAEITASPPSTVETRIRRATQILAEALRSHRDHLPTP